MAHFFNRIGRVEFVEGTKVIFSTDGNSGVTANVVNPNVLRSFDNLDFKFSCKKISDITTIENRANVSILGLNRSTIQFLSTYRPVGVEAQFGKRIRIYASYEDYGDNLIFDGTIENARPTVPPKNWLNISAFVGNYRANSIFSIAINTEITIGELIEKIAETFNVRTMYIDNGTWATLERNRKIKSFEFSGTLRELLKEVSKVSKFLFFEDFGVIKIRMEDPSKFEYAGNSVALISESTGMIGVPEIDVGSLDQTSPENSSMCLVVKTLINPGISIWDQVDVKSVYLPDVNGTYTVRTIEYNGHLRGQNWYQTMYLQSARWGDRNNG